jgi:hypothetical protein
MSLGDLFMSTKKSDEHVSVHVENFDDFPTHKTEEVEPEHFVFSTYVVQGGTTNQGPGNPPYQLILALDPQRKDAAITSPDAAIVICHSYAQAQSIANQVAGIPNPEGFYVPAGGSISLEGTGRAIAVATLNTPARVCVAINRRGSASGAQ